MGFERSFVDGLSEGRRAYLSAREDNRAQDNHDIDMREEARQDMRNQRALELDFEDQPGGLKPPTTTPMNVRPMDGPMEEGAPPSARPRGTGLKGPGGTNPAVMNSTGETGGAPAPGTQMAQGAPSQYDAQEQFLRRKIARSRAMGDLKGESDGHSAMQDLQFTRVYEDGLRRASEMTPEDLKKYLLKETNNDAHKLRVIPVKKTDANGKLSFEYLGQLEENDPVQLSLSEVKRLVALEHAGSNGHAARANQAASDIMAKLRGENLETKTKTAAAAVGMENADTMRMSAMTNERWRSSQEQQGRMGQPIRMIDPKTREAVISVPVMHPGGKVTFVRGDTGGLMFERQLDPKAIEARAAAYVGKPTGRLNNGKPEVYDESAAYAKAYEDVATAELGGGGGGGLPEVKPPPRGGATPPPKPGPDKPTRQIGTLASPRTGAEARQQFGLQPPAPRESDQELFIRSMGYGQ